MKYIPTTCPACGVRMVSRLHENCKCVDLKEAKYALCYTCGHIYHPSGRNLTGSEKIALRSSTHAALIRSEQERVTEWMIG